MELVTVLSVIGLVGVFSLVFAVFQSVHALSLNRERQTARAVLEWRLVRYWVGAALLAAVVFLAVVLFAPGAYNYLKETPAYGTVERR